MTEQPEQPQWEKRFSDQFCQVGRNWLLNSTDKGVGLKMRRDICAFIRTEISKAREEEKKRCIEIITQQKESTNIWKLLLIKEINTGSPPNMGK